MSILPVTNDQVAQDDRSIPQDTVEEKPKKPRKKGPNLNQIHARPLPLEAHPLPAFHPSNPISLLRLAYHWISDVLFPPTSHPPRNYVGYFSPETRSVHVTDPRCIRILWEMGFFGKGNLSRSEPTWIERERARLQKERNTGRGTAAEDLTNKRREERRMFKLERAKVEWEKVERQRMVEGGEMDRDGATPDDEKVEELINVSPAMQDESGDFTEDEREPAVLEHESTALQNGPVNGTTKENGYLQHPNFVQTRESQMPLTQELPVVGYTQPMQIDDEEYRGRNLTDQEHLQLTLEEAFFLSYGLGVLSICPLKRRDPSPLSVKTEPQQYSTSDLLELFCQYSSFPPADSIWITPDDQFLLNYVAYHHFRSLGWVVRPGIKFAVDYLLYNRGPAFSHAEFAVLIIPSYTDRYWNTPGGRARRRVYEQKDWWWLHCVNRVQSQVFKTLVLCYIDIPSELDLDFDEGIDIGKLLRSYKVREFVVKRWLANRSRD